MKTVVIHRCQSDIEADQIRALLHQSDIECQVVSDIPHAVFPINMDGLGEVRIAVLEREAIRAQELINQFLEVPDSPFTPDEDAE